MRERLCTTSAVGSFSVAGVPCGFWACFRRVVQRMPVDGMP